MRVLIISHIYTSGYRHKKLDILRQQGVDIAVAVPEYWQFNNGLFRGRKEKYQHPYPDIPIYPCKVLRPGHPASYLLNPLQLKRCIKEFSPDIIHIHPEVYSLAAAETALLLKKSKARLVIFSWENIDKNLHFIQKLARNIIRRRANLILCGSSKAKNLIRKWKFKGRCEVLSEIGVDTDIFKPIPRSGSSQSMNIGFIGRLVQEKGIDLLLKSAALLKKGNIPCKITICGSGPAENDLNQLSKDLSIDDQVTWINTVEHNDIPSVLSGLDILVLPSRSTILWEEQFGLVLAEAMAMGICCVGSNSGAIPEVIGRSDLIFPENDHVKLCAILTRLHHDKTWRKECSEHGIQHVQDNYSYQTIAIQQKKLYTMLIKENEQQI